MEGIYQPNEARKTEDIRKTADSLVRWRLKYRKRTRKRDRRSRFGVPTTFWWSGHRALPGGHASSVVNVVCMVDVGLATVGTGELHSLFRDVGLGFHEMCEQAEIIYPRMVELDFTIRTLQGPRGHRSAPQRNKRSCDVSFPRHGMVR